MTERKRATGSDLKKVDTRVPTKRDYDEIPELTEEWFARAKWHEGGMPLPGGPRGRPKSQDPKQAVSVRLDPDVLAHFRKGGAGWQSRINAALRRAAKLPERKAKRG